LSDGAVLILNAGSSSLKFTVFRGLTAAGGEVVLNGKIEGIGTSPRYSARNAAREKVADEALDDTVKDARSALAALAQRLRAQFGDARVLGVGHRVVHGGSKYQKPELVTPQLMADLRALAPLAPLHQPHNLDAIEAVSEGLPGVPQVACFDTSFHREWPAVAELVALPADIRGQGVQRYGFHGLSYEYIASALPQVAPAMARGRVIVAHLGNGASLCAMKDGKSVDCTMGFTALDGICMGTRPGAVDPGVILHLFQGMGLTAKEVEDILYKKSGLSGISGLSNDMRDLLASDAPEAKLAIDFFVYRAAQEIGAMAASLGGVDALVFTAGIGENSVAIRQRICEASAWLGIGLDAAANEKGGPCISKQISKVSAWTIPTNEELMIARHTGALLGLHGSQRSSPTQ
jgi:acetate kinase